MNTIQIVQHIPGNITQLYKLRASAAGDRFGGWVAPLGNPAAGGRLEMRVKLGNSAFFQSLTGAKGTSFTVKNNVREIIAVTVTSLDGALVFQTNHGQTLTVPADEETTSAPSVAPVVAVAAVAAVALLVMGAVAVAAMDGDYKGEAKSDDEGTSVSVEANGEGGEGGGDGE